MSKGFTNPWHDNIGTSCLQKYLMPIYTTLDTTLVVPLCENSLDGSVERGIVAPKTIWCDIGVKKRYMIKNHKQ